MKGAPMFRYLIFSLVCIAAPSAALASLFGPSVPSVVRQAPSAGILPPPSRVVGPVPEAHWSTLSAGLPRGQRLVQTLIGDLDGDGKDEWVAIGEPIGTADGVSVAIFAPAAGRKPPSLRFAQIFMDRGLAVAGAEIQYVRPVGNVVALVGAAPSRAGDSRFRLELYGWNGTDFRPLVPEEAEFRSQGGFSIEPGESPEEGDEIVVWSYVPDPDELLYDFHHYTWRRWRFDGIRFVVESMTNHTGEKVSDADAAGRAAGAKKPDRRRQIERVAEVP